MNSFHLSLKNINHARAYDKSEYWNHSNNKTGSIYFGLLFIVFDIGIQNDNTYETANHANKEVLIYTLSVYYKSHDSDKKWLSVDDCRSNKNLKVLRGKNKTIETYRTKNAPCQYSTAHFFREIITHMFFTLNQYGYLYQEINQTSYQAYIKYVHIFFNCRVFH